MPNPNDKQKELVEKQQAEERFKDQMDPMCPGCKRRVASQGCGCAKKDGKKPGEAEGRDDAGREAGDENQATASARQKSAESKELDYLTLAGKEKTAWTQVPGQYDKFEFKNAKALVSMSLDFQNSSLLFTTNKVLSLNDHAVLDKYILNLKGTFKGFCAEQGLTEGKDYKIEERTDANENYKLIIRIADKEHFNAFVNRLMDKNLLPAPSSELREALRPTPLSTRPRPGGSKKQSEDEKKDEVSSFSTPFKTTPFSNTPEP